MAPTERSQGHHNPSRCVHLEANNSRFCQRRLQLGLDRSVGVVGVLIEDRLAAPCEGKVVVDFQSRLGLLGIGTIDDLCCDTYAEENYFFSFRRSVHRNEPDYGRLIAAITLAE